MRERKTWRLGDLAERTLNRLDRGGKRSAARAVALWEGVAGEEIARHTRGFALREGELVVVVDSPAWANELSLMAEQLRVRLNAEAGQELVGSIRFTVSRRVEDDRGLVRAEEGVERFYEPDSIAPVPLNDSERSQVEHVAAAIEDRELRETVVRVMTKDLELKKGMRAAARSTSENASRNEAGNAPGDES